jgi:hypothetical protein
MNSAHSMQVLLFALDRADTRSISVCAKMVTRSVFDYLAQTNAPDTALSAVLLALWKIDEREAVRPRIGCFPDGTTFAVFPKQYQHAAG